MLISEGPHGLIMIKTYRDEAVQPFTIDINNWHTNAEILSIRNAEGIVVADAYVRRPVDPAALEWLLAYTETYYATKE